MTRPGNTKESDPSPPDAALRTGVLPLPLPPRLHPPASGGSTSYTFVTGGADGTVGSGVVANITK